mgnify:CR=1 FL=1
MQILNFLDFSSLEDNITTINEDISIKDFYNCGGLFKTFFNKINSYCKSNLDFRSYNIDSFNPSEYFEIDKSIFGLYDSEVDINYNLFSDIYYDNYMNHKFVYGSNLYLKRLLVYFILLKYSYKDSNSFIWKDVSEYINKFTFGISNTFHNFVSFDDVNEYKFDCIERLLRNGYIDENYLDYISIFHEGSLQKSDYDFLLKLKRKNYSDIVIFL